MHPYCLHESVHVCVNVPPPTYTVLYISFFSNFLEVSILEPSSCISLHHDSTLMDVKAVHLVFLVLNYGFDIVLIVFHSFLVVILCA